MQKTALSEFLFSDLKPLEPTYALIADVDLVVVRWKDDNQVSVLYGRCAHRGALMSDGHIDGDNIICGVHNWDYNFKSGVSSYNSSEKLNHFNAWVEDDKVWIDKDEIAALIKGTLPFKRVIITNDHYFGQVRAYKVFSHVLKN